jgi:ABC-type Fe3+-hydroxamate transport system substrate-binding protein
MNQEINTIDMMGRAIHLNAIPKRIISLVPSQTELLYSLGLNQEVVGQTLFCIHPKEMHLQKPRIGGTKKLLLDKIMALEPDLIIGNKEENDKVQMEQLMEKYPVWMSDIKDLPSALSMIEKIGELVGKTLEAIQLKEQIESEFNALLVQPKEIDCLYLIWREPWMAAGEDTFINDMLQRIGRRNVLEKGSRYPSLTNDEIGILAPKEILLSSEPYPFKEKHIQELHQILPEATIKLVDGEMFSWYGSRLLHSVTYFKKEFML